MIIGQEGWFFLREVSAVAFYTFASINLPADKAGANQCIFFPRQISNTNDANKVTRARAPLVLRGEPSKA